jgi:DNA mismatch repair protein MutL
VRRAVRHVLEAARPGTPLSVAPATPAWPESVSKTAEMAFTHAVGRPAGWRSAAGAGVLARETHEHGGHGEHVGCGHEHAAPAATRMPPAPPETALRPVGQALGTYLVLEGTEQIVLVDQHALHERVLFEQINARLNRHGNLEVQRLLVPQVVHLGGAATARLLEARELLRTLGWMVEPFGDGALAVSGLPAVLRHPDAEGALGEVAALLEEGTREGLDRAALVSSAVDRLACRAAVMAGDKLAPEEVLALLAQSETLNHAHSCPHGRPTRLTLSKKDLERWFHRTV